MYLLLLLGLLAAAAWLVSVGIARHQRNRIALGMVTGVAALAFFALLTFWAEMLWFGALGYGARFWAMVTFRVGTALGGEPRGVGVEHPSLRGVPPAP